MNQMQNTTASSDACAIDRSCIDSGCGCGPQSPSAKTSRRGFRAALFGVLCVLGCLAVPVAIGGFAALGGALSGEIWVLAAGLTLAVVVAFVLKRRGGGSIC